MQWPSEHEQHAVNGRENAAEHYVLNNMNLIK